MVDFEEIEREKKRKRKEQEEKNKWKEPKEKSRKKFKDILNELNRYSIEEVEFEVGEQTYSTVEITNNETGDKVYTGSPQNIEVITLKAVLELMTRLEILENASGGKNK